MSASIGGIFYKYMHNKNLEIANNTPARLDPEIVAAIMTREEYARGRYARPYGYHIESGGKKVTFFGPKHSSNPDDQMFFQLKEELRVAAPDIIVVEGMNQLEAYKEQMKERLAAMSFDAVINAFGEPGFTLRLAFELGIDVVSPELSAEDEIRHLEQKGFSKNQIFAFYVARQIPQYQRMVSRPDFIQYIAPLLKRMESSARWADYDFSIGHFASISKEKWGMDFTPETVGYEEKVDPIPWEDKRDQQGPTNEIARTLGDIREEAIIKKIQNLLKSHSSIFIVYGATHAVVQKPALEKLLQAKAVMHLIEK